MAKDQESRHDFQQFVSESLRARPLQGREDNQVLPKTLNEG